MVQPQGPDDLQGCAESKVRLTSYPGGLRWEDRARLPVRLMIITSQPHPFFQFCLFVLRWPRHCSPGWPIIHSVAQDGRPLWLILLPQPS